MSTYAMAKKSEDFCKLSIIEWLYHHFSSSDMYRNDVQIDIGRSVINEHSPRNAVDCVECWESILERMSGLPWPTDPWDLTEEDLESQGLSYWVGHFYTTDNLEIGEVWLNNATKYGPSFDEWKLLVKENEDAENEWKESLQACSQWDCGACSSQGAA